MYRYRTRPKYNPPELAEIYAEPHDHTRWPDHILRVEKTIEVGKELVFGKGPTTRPYQIADLSCGDAKIALDLGQDISNTFPILGDFAPGYEFTGPIEETIDEIPRVDLFICSETIEHLDDPDLVLRKIRQKADKLLLSTPNCSWPDPNIEHYWSWDSESVELILMSAGWNPKIYEESYYVHEDGRPLGYRYQIWGCV